MRNTVLAILVFALISFSVMVLVDYTIGTEAEFINVWSVIERLTGKTVTASQVNWWLCYSSTWQSGYCPVLAL